MDAVVTITKGDLRLQIFQDEMPMNPRKESDNLGIIVCERGKYDVGDEQIAVDDWDAWLKENVDSDVISLPLYLKDFGSNGIRIDSYGKHQTGIIYVTMKTIAEELIVNAIEVLEDEVETYNQYLNNDVYGYVIEKKKQCACCGHVEWVDVDSCWGYFGHDWDSNGLAESIPEEFREELGRVQR